MIILYIFRSVQVFLNCVLVRDVVCCFLSHAILCYVVQYLGILCLFLTHFVFVLTNCVTDCTPCALIHCHGDWVLSNCLESLFVYCLKGFVIILCKK